MSTGEIHETWKQRIPQVFCWTKYGTEAGELPQVILRRKEVERYRNGGVFLWGIGASILPSLLALLEATDDPRVLFSPMKGNPARQDVYPSRLVMWQDGVGYDGTPYRLPPHSLVTSGRSESVARSKHFALVCRRESPIGVDEAEHANVVLAVTALRNLRSGAVLGASQVTAVVRRLERCESQKSLSYPITMEARLIYPYLVTFRTAVPMLKSGQEY